MLEIFDRKTGELVQEVRIDHLVDINEVIRSVGASSIDDLVLGGWRVEGAAARSLEASLGVTIDETKHSSFVAAVAAGKDEDPVRQT